MEAKQAGDVIYFADGVHPQHNTKSAYAWIERGQEKEILSVSGRSRVNINAVMNAENPCQVVMVESESINAQSTLELYKKIEILHPEARNIYVICDNARYYKNTLLNQSLEGSKIKQIFLPPYSPNLNLIERLWKFMRKKVINHHFIVNLVILRKPFLISLKISQILRQN
ncbi:MAG: IS630 family transposase [Saprospiraceae bacterium]|nr:IS630 family transposase [Saprospiraceae bacterium]